MSSPTIVLKTLTWCAARILKRYKPLIVAVTGSVGKTSAKQAIGTVLSAKWPTRAASKNYNNELGVPLAIIGTAAPGRSPVKWAAVFGKAFDLLIVTDRRYPKALVLEFGADHPGDIAHLLSFVHPHVGVLTAIGEAHMEFFKTQEALAREKSLLITSLPKNGIAILNADDVRVASVSGLTSAKVLQFGIENAAEVNAKKILIVYDIAGRASGMSMEIAVQGKTETLEIAGVIGTQHAYAALAGIACGLAVGVPLHEAVDALRRYAPPPGRMRLLKGIKETTLVDDTYNASPTAALAALEALRSVEVPESAERYACVGDMLELGEYTEAGHRSVGKKIAELGIDVLVTVGERAKLLADEARRCGLEEHRIISLDTADEAGKFLQNKIKKGDVVLLKGSQGMRMEKAVFEIMAEPERASELLCRQDPAWIT